MTNIALVSTIGQLEALLDVTLNLNEKTVLIIKRNKKNSLEEAISSYKHILELNKIPLKIEYIDIFRLLRSILSYGQKKLYIPRGSVNNIFASYLSLLFTAVYVIPDGAVPTEQIINTSIFRVFNSFLVKKVKYFNHAFSLNNINDRKELLNIIYIKPLILKLVQNYFSKKDIGKNEILIIGKNKISPSDLKKIILYIDEFIYKNSIIKVHYMPHPREKNILHISFKNIFLIESYLYIDKIPEYIISIGSSAIEFFQCTHAKRIFLRPKKSDYLVRGSARSNITAEIILDI